MTNEDFLYLNLHLLFFPAVKRQVALKLVGGGGGGEIKALYFCIQVQIELVTKFTLVDLMVVVMVAEPVEAAVIAVLLDVPLIVLETTGNCGDSGS